MIRGAVRNRGYGQGGEVDGEWCDVVLGLGLGLKLGDLFARIRIKLAINIVEEGFGCISKEFGLRCVESQLHVLLIEDQGSDCFKLLGYLGGIILAKPVE